MGSGPSSASSSLKLPRTSWNVSNGRSVAGRSPNGSLWVISCTGPLAPFGSDRNRQDVSAVVALAQVLPLAGTPTSAGMVVSAALQVPLTVTFGCCPTRKNGRPSKFAPALAADVHCETPAVQGAVTVTSTLTDQSSGSLFDAPGPVARSCSTPPTIAAVHFRFCTFSSSFSGRSASRQ